MNRYEGRRVLITGGGSGIGRATVHRILSEGGRVHTVDVSEAGLKATADRALADGHGERLTTTVLDISDEAAVRTGVAAAVAALGGIDVLVNAAGILRSAHTHQTTLDLWNQVISVNLTGTFLVIREALPALLEGDQPVVVNFSSTSASFAHPYMSAYAASKGGIQSMTHALAAEYSKQGLRFVAVAPRLHRVRDDHRQRPRPARGHRLEPVHQARPRPRPGLRRPADRRRRRRDAGLRGRRLHHRYGDPHRRRHALLGGVALSP
ncbi:hypothetical protein GCM10020254_59230 [Streptomyces goshikiensis]